MPFQISNLLFFDELINTRNISIRCVQEDGPYSIQKSVLHLCHHEIVFQNKTLKSRIPYRSDGFDFKSCCQQKKKDNFSATIESK